VIYRVPPTSRRRPPRVPGLPAAHRLRGDEPRPPPESHYDYFLDLIRGDDDSAEGHRQFYDEYNAVLDMPAEYYLDTIKTVFQDFALVNGTWTSRRAGAPAGHHATALLTIEGELDDISGAGQTRAAHDLCTGIPKNRQFHYDVSRAPATTASSRPALARDGLPEVREFIAAHGTGAPRARQATLPRPRRGRPERR
jgi:poly(3-hydroxybutyrate) depolymerase